MESWGEWDVRQSVRGFFWPGHQLGAEGSVPTALWNRFVESTSITLWLFFFFFSLDFFFPPAFSHHFFTSWGLSWCCGGWWLPPPRPRAGQVGGEGSSPSPMYQAPPQLSHTTCQSPQRSEPKLHSRVMSKRTLNHKKLSTQESRTSLCKPLGHQEVMAPIFLLTTCPGNLLVKISFIVVGGTLGNYRQKKWSMMSRHTPW